MTNSPTLLFNLIQERAKARPDDPAILAPGKKALAYRGLAGHLEAVALQLTRLGIRRGDRVAVVLPNGPEMATAFLALSSVCTCAPLNPAYLQEEYTFYLTDLQARAVVVPAGVEHAARRAAVAMNLPLLELEPDPAIAGLFGLASQLPADLSVDRPVLAELGDVAMVLHTSGTTSRPKIVPLTQSNLFFSVGNISGSYALTSADRCLNVMPLFHIHGLMGALSASLSAGGSVICAPGFQPEHVMDWLSDLEPTWYSAVPTMHQVILEQTRSRPEKARPIHLRFIRSCSASLPPQIGRDLEAAFAAPVLEAYGMTEASHQIASNPLPPAAHKFGSVGRSTGATQVSIRDGAGQALAAGTPGEICIRGGNVMDGYENNPQANAASFVDGWLRTGDLGSLDEEGYIFIQGRIKEIINRGGEKVSPREVDEVLLRHPAVKQAVAFAAPHPTLGEEVAAAVVLQEGQAVTMRELRQFAASRLADFKVPARIVFVKEIPKGPTGKIQRIGLAEKLRTELEALKGSAADSGPQNEVEAVIQSIWQEVLGVERVGLREDYLVLGGDSIRAARILMKVNERFGTNLVLAAIFDTPTVAEMAGAVQSNVKSPGPGLSLPAIRSRQGSEAPLSPQQAGLWLIQQIEPQTVAYNSAYLFKLTGRVDRQALERALNELVRRHASLRTVYPGREGKPVQVVLPFEPFSLPVVDYSELPAEERGPAIHRYAVEHESRPFDLEREPSGRYALLHAGPEANTLFICIHHINCDAWSRYVFMADLVQLYAACQAGRQADLPVLPIQYADHAWTYEEWLEGEARSFLLEHWKGVLSGELPVLELPTDRPRPAIQTDHGACHHFQLPADLTERIREYCRRERMMPFHLLAGAYTVLLGRYSGQTDILFGCPFANRPRPEQQDLIGLFTNVLPIRMNLDGDPPAGDVFRQARRVLLEAFTWQELPFPTLVSELAPPRDLSRTPIYQVAINLLNVPRRPASVPGLEVSEVRREQKPAQFDMTFEFTEEGGQFAGVVEFNTDLLDRATIVRRVTHFLNILEGMLAQPERPISAVELLSEAERRQILVEWNATAAAYPRDRCIHEWIEAQSDRTPDSIALVYQDRQMSYREMNALANRIARRLRKMGAGPEVPVGVYLERSTELVAAILGILKSGSPFVPLDTLYPPGRRAEIIRDSGMRILVTKAELVTDEFPGELGLLVLNESRELAAESVRNPKNVARPENLAYIIYTSGSTGKPKGVEITHRSLVNCLLSAKECAGIRNGGYSLMVTSPTFDISIFSYLVPLFSGGTVALTTREEMYDSRLLARRITELPLGWILATPAIWQMLFDAGWQGKPGLKILSAGEAIAPELAERLMQTCGEVYNLYGPTETTITSTSGRLQPGQPVTVGRPIANTAVYILDGKLHPVPVGVVGELHLGGDGLARGYHNRPELTLEKFFPDPFSEKPGARLYPSGDLGKFRPDGQIELLGRRDDQVKIRGYRIEPGEIEAALAAHPGIRQVLVMAREDRPGDKRLVAYLIPQAGQTLEQLQLRDFLKDSLPAYMIPAAFVCMEAFPLTLSGKLDRKALPAPRLEQASGREAEPARTTTELALARIWMEVLALPRVSLTDDFFAIGGNSLFAVRVMTRIQHELGVNVPIYRIFESPRLADLARQVDLELGRAGQPAPGMDVPGDREEFIL